MDWIHCNICFACPSASHETFCLSSCGHLFCTNCLTKKDGVVLASSNVYICRVCKKKCSYLEVNRSLKSDLQMFFRHPRELLNQYMRNMKSVIEFQTFHRSHFQKYLSEKASKASKYAKQIHVELTKKAEYEKTLNSECERLRLDLEKQAELVQSLQNLIAEKDREITQMHQKTVHTSSRQTKHNKLRPNLNSNTPLSTLSFINCATSTPICDMPMFDELDAPMNNGKVKNMFSANSGEFDTPIARDGGFLSGSPANALLNTPAMLGLSQMHGNEKFCGSRVGNFF